MSVQESVPSAPTANEGARPPVAAPTSTPSAPARGVLTSSNAPVVTGKSAPTAPVTSKSPGTAPAPKLVKKMSARPGNSFPTGPVPSPVLASASAEALGKRSRSADALSAKQVSPLQPVPSPGSLTNASLATPTGTPITPTSSAGGNTSFAERIAPKFVEALCQRSPGEEPLPASETTAVGKAIAATVATTDKPGPQARTLITALKDPLHHDLRDRLRTGALAVTDFVAMGEMDLMNPETVKQVQETKEFRAKARNVKELWLAKATVSHDFACPACGKKKHTLVQKQTRSGDEPMTIYCTCLECGRSWRIRD